MTSAASCMSAVITKSAKSLNVVLVTE
jgi:hypothetical protein